MPNPAPFTGSDFKLQSVTQIAAATIRVRFTYDPLAANPAGANDALNIAQYVATGPAANAITSAATVPDDPSSIDITFAAPLAIGDWTLTASVSIQTAGGRPLQPPLALGFTVTFMSLLEPVSGGAVNDSAESVIRKHLGPAFKGKAWDALIAALAVADRLNWDNAKLAFDQLFKSTASGIYLDRKCADDGLARPHALGMPDELFRKLAVKVTANKLTQDVLLEILEVFYGPDSVRAHLDTELAEPFRLAAGDALTIVVDDRETIQAIFTAEDANQISQAKAREVAAALTRAFRANKNKSWATTFVDTTTGKARIRIYSSSLGLGSSLKITGGRAQKGLQFETRIATPPAGTTPSTIVWDVTVPEAGRARYTLTGASALDMNLLVPGDYMLVTGATFQAENRGSFKIEDVSVSYAGATLTQYIDVLNDAVVAQASIAEQALDDVLFFRPTKKTIHVGISRTVVVAQNTPGELDIVIPASTQAVGRTVNSGAYAKLATALTVTALTRDATGLVTVTAAAHGLTTGSRILVDEAWGNLTAPTFVAGDEGLGQSDACLASIWSSIRPQVQQGCIYQTATKLQNGKVLIAGGGADPTFTGFITPVATCEQFGITSTTTLAGGEIRHNYNWFAASSLATARDFHAATLLNDGRVLASAGFNGTVTLASTEIYTPNATTGTWAAGPALAQARAMHSSNLLTNGTVLIAGGLKDFFEATATAEIFDPVTNLVAATGSMVEPRGEHEAVSLAANKVLAIGGRAMARGHFLDSNILGLWRFDETAGTTAADAGPNGFTLATGAGAPAIVAGKIGKARTVGPTQYMQRAAPEPVLEAGFKAEWTVETWVSGATGGTIVAFGVNSEAQADNRLIDISFVPNSTLTWGWENGAGVNVGGVSNINGAWSTSGWNHIAIVKVKNAVTPTNFDVLIYMNAVLHQTFSNNANADGGANGVLLVGAGPEGSGSDFTIDDLRISTKARSATEISESYTRGAAGALQLGGIHSLGQFLSTCEVFNGSTWARTGSMAWARTGHRAVGLPDGRVLVTGGFGYRANALPPTLFSGYQYISDAEIWDPGTGCWSPAGRTTVGRAWHTATLLPARNQVLVRGGTAIQTQITEIFEIPSLTFRTTPINSAYSTIMFWQNLRAVLMDDGTVFVNGGYDDPTNLVSLLYIPASDYISVGGLTGEHKILSTTAGSFTYRTLNFPGLTTNANSGISIYPVAAPAATTIPGPYVFEPDAGAAVTGIATVSSQDLYEGSQYTTLNVANASQFPDEEGYLAIAFGTESAVYPVRYLGRYSATALILDYQFKFPITNLSGATVTYLSQKGFFSPEHPEEVGSCYITASSAGRVAAQKTIGEATAAGIKINTTIVYPGDLGLGGAGLPVTGTRISDKVAVFGGDDLDAELGIAHGDE